MVQRTPPSQTIVLPFVKPLPIGKVTASATSSAVLILPTGVFAA
jgi:hypothetical protein